MASIFSATRASSARRSRRRIVRCVAHCRPVAQLLAPADTREPLYAWLYARLARVVQYDAVVLREHLAAALRVRKQLAQMRDLARLVRVAAQQAPRVGGAHQRGDAGHANAQRGCGRTAAARGGVGRALQCRRRGRVRGEQHQAAAGGRVPQRQASCLRVTNESACEETIESIARRRSSSAGRSSSSRARPSSIIRRAFLQQRDPGACPSRCHPPIDSCMVQSHARRVMDA